MTFSQDEVYVASAVRIAVLMGRFVTQPETLPVYAAWIRANVDKDLPDEVIRKSALAGLQVMTEISMSPRSQAAVAEGKARRDALCTAHTAGRQQGNTAVA